MARLRPQVSLLTLLCMVAFAAVVFTFVFETPAKQFPFDSNVGYMGRSLYPGEIVRRMIVFVVLIGMEFSAGADRQAISGE